MKMTRVGILALTCMLGALFACNGEEVLPGDAGTDGPGTPDGGSTSTVVGSSGGTFSFHGGKVKLEVPPGALSKDTTIRVLVLQSYPKDSRLVPGTVYDLLPDGTTFNKAVKLSITYQQASVPPGVAEADLRIHKVVSGSWKLISGGDVDTKGHLVWANLEGFSKYGVKGPKPAAVDGLIDMGADAGVDLTVPVDAAQPDVADGPLPDKGQPDVADGPQADLKSPCSGQPSGAPCNDGNPCTKGDACDGTGTCKGTPYVCKSGQCETSSACNGQGGCMVAYKLSGASCDDKDLCTKGDICDGTGVCKGTPYVCKPGMCNGACDGKGGCTTAFKPKGATCDDKRICTLGDVCDGSGNCMGSMLKSDHCLITGICYKDGTKHATVSCYQCDVNQSQSVWTPSTNTCLIDAKCYFHGDPNSGKCAQCESVTSNTSWTVKGNACLINNVCYKPGDQDAVTCASCDPTKNKYNWTVAHCKIDGKCYIQGAMSPGGCAECDPTTSTTSWTVKGNACLINNVCRKPGDLDTSTCGSCDPTKNKYGWTSIAYCKFDGKCYAKGAKHPGGCAECDPFTSTTSWTVKGNACLINNACQVPGDKNAFGCASCDPAKNKYGWTSITGLLCKIEGNCYSKGAKHPGGCATCDPLTSTSSWTVTGTTHCLISNVCRASGHKDLGGCATCNPSKSKYAYTLLPGKCSIDGACHNSGAKHPGGCGSCAPAKSTTTWTPSGNNCVIDHACHASGAKHAAGCGTCDPSKSQTDWTVSGNQCLIGSACRASGAKEPGGCGVCDPAKSKTSWSRSSGCLVAHAWSKKLLRLKDMAVDGNGNIYITGGFDTSVNLGGSALSSKDADVDVYLASFTPSGKHRWSKAFGGKGTDEGHDVAVDGSGNVTVSGTFAADISFGGGWIWDPGGKGDIFVASFTSDGKHRWSKGFRRADKMMVQEARIAADSAGNTYITGTFKVKINFGGGYPKTDLKGSSGDNTFLASFDSAGKHRWSRNFCTGPTACGVVASAIAVDSNGSTYLTGRFGGKVSFAGSTVTTKSQDAFVASFSTAGGDRWFRKLGGTSSDFGYGVAVDSNANVFVTGFIGTSADLGGGVEKTYGVFDIFVAAYTTSGAYRWSRVFGSSLSDEGYGISTDNMGNVYVTGFFANSVDFGGGMLSTKGAHDMFIVSLDPAGKHRWSRAFGSTWSDYGRLLENDDNGNTYVVGTFHQTVDLGGGSIAFGKVGGYVLLKLSP